MGQHLPTIHVAYGIDSRHGGLHVVIDLDARAGIIVEACQLEVVRYAGRTAHGHQHLVGLNGLFLSFLVLESDALRRNGRHATLHAERDAAFL